MDAAQTVALLLAEYNTLRAEVMAARGNVAQAAGIAAATTMAIFAFKYSNSINGPSWLPWALLVATWVVYFIPLVTWNELNTRGFTTRLREIEAELNRRARQRLMLWETDWGWGGMFWPVNPHHKGYSVEWPPDSSVQPPTPQSN